MYATAQVVVFLLQSSGLHYRHTDNVVQFFGACEDAGLPSVSLLPIYRPFIHISPRHVSSRHGLYSTRGELDYLPVS